MNARSLLEERVFGEVHRLCYAGLDAETLHRRTVGCLRRVIPFEGYCAHDADPVSGLLMRIQMDPPDEQRARFFLEHVYFEDRINDFDWMVRTRRPVSFVIHFARIHPLSSMRCSAGYSEPSSTRSASSEIS